MEAQGGAPQGAQESTLSAQGGEAEARGGDQIPAQANQKEGQAPSAVKDAAKEAMRKFKVKVDGREEEVDEGELIRGYSHQRAANKKLQEGVAARKQAEAFINMLRDENQLFDVLKKVGHDETKLRKLAEGFLTEKIKYEMLPEEQRKLLEAERRLREYEEIEKKRQEEAKRQHDEAMRKKYSEEYTKQFVDVLKAEKLPANNVTVAEMAKYIARAAKIGFEMTPQEAAKLVAEDIEQRHRALYGNADAEYLIKVLGEEAIQKLRAHDVAQIKSPEQYLKTPSIQEQGEATRQRARNKRMTPREWRKHKYGL